MPKPLHTENNASSQLGGQERTATLSECVSKVCSKVSGTKFTSLWDCPVLAHEYEDKKWEESLMRELKQLATR